jgi:hypothetical protein
MLAPSRLEAQRRSSVSRGGAQMLINASVGETQRLRTTTYSGVGPTSWKLRCSRRAVLPYAPSS